MPRGGPVGPLAPYLRLFARSLSLQGYTRCYLRRHLMLAACFSRWLKQHRVPLRCITSEHTARYLRYRYRERQAAEGDAGALRHMLAFLREQRAIPADKTPRLPP